jgi:hypothetical protein
MTAPGPLNLSGWCRGGACPHDHGDPAVCAVCGGDFWPAEPDHDACVACAPLLEMDARELRELVVEQRVEIATLRRYRWRRELADGV